MKKKSLIALALLSMLLIGLTVLRRNLVRKELYEVSVAGHALSVEIADEPHELMRGLMSRKELDQNQGMLFVFENLGRHPFWMKNTLISLDMLWLNENFEIIHIENSVPPCRESPCLSYAAETNKAKYVLEVNGGWTLEKGVKVGDVVEFSSREI